MAKRKKNKAVYREIKNPFILCLFSFIFFGVMILLSLFSNNGLMAVYKLNIDISQLKGEIVKIRSENSILEKKMKLLRDADKRTIEKLAREKLYMSKPGEIVIELTD